MRLDGWNISSPMWQPGLALVSRNATAIVVAAENSVSLPVSSDGFDLNTRNDLDRFASTPRQQLRFSRLVFRSSVARVRSTEM